MQDYHIHTMAPHVRKEPSLAITILIIIRIKILSRICTSRGWNHRMYHGKMTPEAREKMICEFREVDDVQILVASLKCGGVGLNLTCASRVINIDLFWVCLT